jgi:hypothetical protein
MTMIIAGIMNLYALALAAGFGLLVAAVYAVFIMKKSSLETQANKIGLAPGSGSPALRGYHGLYREFYVALEPGSEGRSIRVSIAHPDQDKVLVKPQLPRKSISDIQVNENVLVFRIMCSSPGKPGSALKEMIDTAINLL